MSLDLSSVGFKTEPYDFEYDWQTAALYALGIGATAGELELLYERHGPRVFPTFAVVPAYPALSILLERARVRLELVVHGGQTVRLTRAIPASGNLETVGRIDGLYDLKRFARLVFSTQSRHNGELICETEWDIIVRDSGGFGGPRPPKIGVVRPPKDVEPAFVHSQKTQPEQALLYRLSGDLNPLHVDPQMARQAGFERGPILHGLCTFGFMARAFVAGACQGDERRLRALGAQFRAPVWPGETLITSGFQLDTQKYSLVTRTGDSDDPVVTGAWAEIAA